MAEEIHQFSSPLKKAAFISLHSEAENCENSSNRSFGFVFAGAFGVIGLLPLIGHHPLRRWAVLLAVGLLILALVRPGLLTWPNVIWSKFGRLLHSITSPVGLFLIYVLAVIPTGLILRVMNKNPLALKFDPTCRSYWIQRQPPGRSDGGMHNQF